MRLRSSPSLVACTLGAGFAVSCFAIGEGVVTPLDRGSDAGREPMGYFDAAPMGTSDEGGTLPEMPPHAVRSVDPPHGPWNGGQRAVVRGNGFSSAVRIWFGENEVNAADVVPLDPTRVQVAVPAGSAGTVDVTAENGDDASTRATAKEAYVYDPFYVTPSSGPRAGGTVITLHGNGTSWTASTTVLVDGSPCEVLALRSPGGQAQELECRTPPGTPGAKRIVVTTAGAKDEVLDAFVYGDTQNGFRGGLSGSPLGGELRVIALNSYTGRGLPGATVVLGSDASGSNVFSTDGNGVVVVQKDGLGPTQTVTVAAHCFMPTTFVGVPVDTVTVYLDPVLSPTCTDLTGTPSGVGTGGGSAGANAHVAGEIVFPGGIELQRAVWKIPKPAAPDARQVAYVFEMAPDSSRTFRLPDASLATTPDSDGIVGYAFELDTAIGNVSLYALAGIEDRSVSPALFTAYSLGIVRGIGTEPGKTVSDVVIDMNIPLDHAISLTVDGPEPTPRGPDRVEGKVGVRVGAIGYVILPIGTATGLLPSTAPLSFVGLPPLVNGLAGGEYILSSQAYTGTSKSPPKSYLGRYTTDTQSGAFTLSGFMEVPRLVTPASNSLWDGRDLAIDAAPGGPDPDLVLFEIQSGSGLSTWTVVAPRGVSSVTLPELAGEAPFGLGEGAVTLTVSRAHIDGFDYGSLRYGDLVARGWDSYAEDVFQVHH